MAESHSTVPSSGVKLKVCTVCGQSLPLDDFYPVKNHPNQRQSRCIPCNRKTVLEWRKANPEKARKHRADSQKRCRAHVSAYHYKWTKKNGVTEGLKKLNRYLKRSYGISLQQFEEMLIAQGGACAICGRTEAGDTERNIAFFTVDHCHKTGEVRGILCRRCNMGIGHLEDDPSIVQKALLYLLGKTHDTQQAGMTSDCGAVG